MNGTTVFQAMDLSLSQKLVEWRDRVNNNPQFNKKILTSLGIGLPPEKTEDTVHLTVEVWFSDGQASCVNYIFQNRALLEGERGPDVQSMGTVISLGDISSPLFWNGIAKTFPLLLKIGYTGPISLETIASKSGIFGRRLHIGLLPFSIYPFLEMYKGNGMEMINQIFSGVPTQLEFKSVLGIGIDISLLPFPLESCECFGRTRQELPGFNPQNLKHFWSLSVDEVRGKYYTTGGRLGVVTARGDTIPGFPPLRDARRRVLRTISNLKIPGLIYREDIGFQVDSFLSKLRNWGIIS